jgi:hypothetical protein
MNLTSNYIGHESQITDNSFNRTFRKIHTQLLVINFKVYSSTFHHYDCLILRTKTQWG